MSYFSNIIFYDKSATVFHVPPLNAPNLCHLKNSDYYVLYFFNEAKTERKRKR